MKFCTATYVFVACIASVALTIVRAQTNALTGEPSRASVSVKTHVATLLKSDGPSWRELSLSQQQALMPLNTAWEQIDAPQKLKWIEISRRFEKMKPDEQSRMQERMRAWVALTPEQRRVAREVYSRSRQLNADQRSAQWQQYQQLPEEQKQKLKAQSSKSKVRTLAAPNANTAIVPPLKSVERRVLQQSVSPQLRKPISATPTTPAKNGSSSLPSSTPSVPSTSLPSIPQSTSTTSSSATVTTTPAATPTQASGTLASPAPQSVAPMPTTSTPAPAPTPVLPMLQYN